MAEIAIHLQLIMNEYIEMIDLELHMTAIHKLNKIPIFMLESNPS